MSNDIGAKKTLAVMAKQNFSILKRGNTYIVRARQVTEGVLAQIRSLLKKAGRVYVDSEKMSKAAAFRYIASQLQKRAVQVVFRRK